MLKGCAVLSLVGWAWPGWEERAGSARSVFGVGTAMVDLEDWIALDYPPDTQVTH